MLAFSVLKQWFSKCGSWAKASGSLGTCENAYLIRNAQGVTGVLCFSKVFRKFLGVLMFGKSCLDAILCMEWVFSV